MSVGEEPEVVTAAVGPHHSLSVSVFARVERCVCVCEGWEMGAPFPKASSGFALTLQAFEGNGLLGEAC